MPNFPYPICVEQLCASLRALRDQVPEDAVIAIDSALAEMSDDALLLVFTELAASAVLIFRGDGAYQFPAEHQRQAPAELAGPPRWLAYSARRKPQVRACAFPGEAGVDPRVAHGRSRDLSQTLSRFHFFRGLEAVLSQIAVYDADLTAKLQQLQTLRRGFAEELDGHELNLLSAAAIALVEDGTVRLELVLDWDKLHPEAQVLPAAHSLAPYKQNIVLLGRDLEFDRCALDRFSRAA